MPTALAPGALLTTNALADLQAERYLLSMCLDGGWEAVDTVSALISPDHFFSQRHRAVFDSILMLWSTRTVITWEAVVYGLGDLPLEEIHEGENEGNIKQFVYAIHSSVPYERTQAEYLCSQLQEKFRLRRLNLMLKTAQEKVLSGLFKSEEIQDALGEQVIMSGSGQAHLGRTVGEVLDSGYRDEIMARLRDPSIIPGIRTGQWIIDSVLGGLENGRVYTGLAGTGLGKSWFVHWLALEVAKRGNRPLIFSTEMGDKEVISRMAYMHAGLDSLPFRTGKAKAKDDEIFAVEQATYDIANFPITVVNSSSMDVAALAMEVKRQQTKIGANVVFVDHIQGLRAKGLTMAQERELINEITAANKAMAMNLDVPVVQISHTRREQDGEITRPSLSSGHGSGSIERDSDSIFSLHPVIPSSMGTTANFSSRQKLNEVRERDGKVGMEVMWHKSRSGGSPYALYYLNFNRGGQWSQIMARA